MNVWSTLAGAENVAPQSVDLTYVDRVGLAVLGCELAERHVDVAVGRDRDVRELHVLGDLGQASSGSTSVAPWSVERDEVDRCSPPLPVNRDQAK